MPICHDGSVLRAWSDTVFSNAGLIEQWVSNQLFNSIIQKEQYVVCETLSFIYSTWLNSSVMTKFVFFFPPDTPMDFSWCVLSSA